jgi:hypothetical protein
MLSHNFKLNFESDEEDDDVIKKKFQFNYNETEDDEEEDNKPGDSKNSKLIKPNFFDSDEEDEVNKRFRNKDNISNKIDSNTTSNIII